METSDKEHLLRECVTYWKLLLYRERRVHGKSRARRKLYRLCHFPELIRAVLVNGGPRLVFWTEEFGSARDVLTTGWSSWLKIGSAVWSAVGGDWTGKLG